MRAVAITGLKRSGKTALISLLAEALERLGKQVSIVKYSGHPLEKSNTDAFWFMRPGRVVVSVSPEETSMLWSKPLSLKDIARHLQTEILLVEGGENQELPRILCLKEGTDEELEALSPKGFKAKGILAVVGSPELPLALPESGSCGSRYFREASPETADFLARMILDFVPES